MPGESGAPGAMAGAGRIDLSSRLRAERFAGLAGGGRFEPLDHSFGYGIGGRAWRARDWMVRAIWEPLWLESADPPTGRKLAFDAGTVQVDLAGFLPPRGRARYGLGLGLGYYSLHGRREYAGVQNA